MKGAVTCCTSSRFKPTKLGLRSRSSELSRSERERDTCPASFRNHHGLGAEREESSGRRADRERIILELKERRCRSAESTGKRNNGIEGRALFAAFDLAQVLGMDLGTLRRVFL